MTSRDPTERFTDRVESYVSHRPSYPLRLLDYLVDDLGLSAQSEVADVGSGTGIWTAQILRLAGRVYAVEPNDAMRAAAEERLASDARFVSVAGSAEDTTLPENSVDFITAAQAFHWFRPTRTRTEFERILRPRGRVVLVWNRRLESGTEFREAYEKLLRRWGTDYVTVRASWKVELALEELFGSDGWIRVTFPHAQSLQLAGLRGRLLSSSYAPPPGHPSHEPMLEALEELHRAHEVDGRVTLEYETAAYVGTLDRS